MSKEKNIQPKDSELNDMEVVFDDSESEGTVNDTGKTGKDGQKKKDEPENAYERQLRQRKKRKRVKTLITLFVLAVIGVVGYQLFLYLKKLNAAETKSVSTTTYRVQMVTEGSITTSMSSSGKLSPIATETEYCDYTDSTVKKLNIALNDTVKCGDILMELTLDEDNELITEYDELTEKIASTESLADSKYLRSSSTGYIKDIKYKVGDDVADIMEQYGYIALLCLDNRMQLDIQTSVLSRYEKVYVQVDGKSYDGVVYSLSGSYANIVIESCKPAVGAIAEVYKLDGTLAGSGAMQLISYSEITAVDGLITGVTLKDGELVHRNGKIALCKDLPTSQTYQDLVDDLEELSEKITDATVITAPFDGRIIEIDVAEGDTLEQDAVLLVIQSLEGYRVSLSVDELDIASLKLGQSAKVELDALEGEYDGTVSYISYVNSSSGNTVRYTVEVSVEDIPGALPSMSATCTIVTSDSGNGLIVPADAIHTQEGKTFVYLAPDGANFGKTYAEEEIDLSQLSTVEVTILQSNGSSVLVSGDLKNRDMILITSKTTSSTYTSSSTSNSFDMSSMMGGGMPNMGGGNMPSSGSWSRSGSGSNSSRSSGSNSSRSSSGSNRG